MTVTETSRPRGPCGHPPAPRRPLQRAVEGRRPRAAQRQRDVEAGGRRPQRPRAHRAGLLARGLRLDPAAGPARAASAGGGSTPSASPASTAAAPRSSSDDRAERRVLHAAGAASTAAPHAGAAARRSAGISTDFARDTADITRPAEHPVPLDPRRGRARDLAAPRGRRPADDRGLRRHPPRHPRQPRRRHRRRRDHRPDAGHRTRSPSRFIGDPELANLPRKFKTAITGHPSLDVVHEINDISLVGVVHPELGAGYDLWVGGGLSTTPRLAERLGVFVSAGRGRRRLARRHLDLPRLRLPPAAQQGPPEVPAGRVGPGEVPRGARDRVPRPPARPTARRRRPPTGPGDHVGVHLQKDGNFYVGATPTVGRISGTPADRARRPRRGRRLRPGAPHPAPEARRARRRPPTGSTPSSPTSSALGLSARPARSAAHDGLHRHRVLQARHRRDQGHGRHGAIAELERRLADLVDDGSLTRRSLNVNGCPNSCARIQIADIGLKGHDRHRPTASRSPASRCTSAAASPPPTATRPASAAPSAASRSPPTDLPDYVERVVRRFVAERADGETFAAWATAPTRSAAVTDHRRPTGHAHGAAPAPQPRPSSRPLADDFNGARRARARTPTADEVAAWAARTLRRHPRRRLLAWRMPCCRTSSSRFAPRRRRALPRHRLPLRRDARDPRQVAEDLADHARRRPARAHRRRAGRRVRRAASTSATPPCAASCARSSRCARTLGGYEAWVTGVRRDEAPTRADTPLVTWDEQERAGQDQPARGVDLRRARRRTPTTTASRSTRCSPTATRRSAASRAPAGSRPATTPAPAAGPASPRPSADSTHDDDRRTPLQPRRSSRHRRSTAATRPAGIRGTSRTTGG